MSRIELIAEVATNHGGNMAIAKEFIDRFSEAGADWIKFQYTRVAHLRPTDGQRDWFTKSELSDDQFAELKAHTESCGAKFLLTVYNWQDVPAVRTLCDVAKIGSGEARESSLLQAIDAAAFSRVIVSGKGLHYPPKWERLRVIARYPTPTAYAIRIAGGVYYCEGADRGWSDHVVGLEACEEAMMAGSRIIEKHVQLDNQARPCRPFEATVSEFKHLRTFADDDPDIKFKGRWQYA